MLSYQCLDAVLMLCFLQLSTLSTTVLWVVYVAEWYIFTYFLPPPKSGHADSLGTLLLAISSRGCSAFAWVLAHLAVKWLTDNFMHGLHYRQAALCTAVEKTHLSRNVWQLKIQESVYVIFILSCCFCALTKWQFHGFWPLISRSIINTSWLLRERHRLFPAGCVSRWFVY